MHARGALLHNRGDRAVAEVAGGQERVVSMAQLHEAGLTRRQVATRVERGWLRRVHRGVYAVGHAPLAERGHLWAAVLAAGGPTHAALSHRTAAKLHGLIPSRPRHIDVTTTLTSHGTKAICVHRAKCLKTTHIDGLPVTTVPQTLLDIATELTPHRLSRACERAEELRTLDLRAVHALLEANRGRPGTRRLREALETFAHDPAITRQELEERFFELVAEAGLPRPLVNTRVAGYEADFFWPDLRLIVETDGMETHLTRRAFTSDRVRDNVHQLAGYRVLRLTWAQVVHEPRYVVEILARARASTATPTARP